MPVAVDLALRAVLPDLGGALGISEPALAGAPDLGVQPAAAAL
jgi:hypothetical protein